MVYDLSKIKENLLDISDAIGSVLHLDLTIVDQDLRRIVATGRYQEHLGEKVSEQSVFSFAMKNKKSFIIKEPKKHPACLHCSKRENCEEYAEVCSPIKINNQVIGVIGLIAFDEIQRKMILRNDESTLNFLDKMSDLIATKVLEEENRQRLLMQSEELEFLFNAVNSAIISVDPKLNVIKFNQYAKKLFSKLNKKTQLTDIFKIKDLKEFSKKKTVSNNILEYNDKQFIYTKKPILDQGKVIEIVLEIKGMKSIINTVNEMMGDYSKIMFNDIVGENKLLEQTKKIAKMASHSDSTVLIQGESGVGKELFARAIHNESKKKNAPFIALNCAAIPESLIESELFGYAEGSFTGAKKSGRIGKFELANQGTIFLDEIGDLPIHLQSKLLRVIQERQFRRLGSNKIIKVDVRIITATNRDLEQMVAERQFREDLYYRLNVIPIYVPSLYDRRDDLEALTEHFVNKYSRKLNKKIISVADNVINCFKNFPWKGNVRELENTIEFAINMTEDNTIKKKDLPTKFQSQNESFIEAVVNPIEVLERNEIIKAIKLYGKDTFGYKKAYEALGISRATFYRKIKKYNID
ncbi:MAG TPA: sigma 54-interacting transcriptional regulator [Clostridia bacterium]|nr:sigma 54-interacting transcriptional regulator [Clostridia bacterium]